MEGEIRVECVYRTNKDGVGGRGEGEGIEGEWKVG